MFFIILTLKAKVIGKMCRYVSFSYILINEDNWSEKQGGLQI
jgi:hypothetical protein